MALSGILAAVPGGTWRDHRGALVAHKVTARPVEPGASPVNQAIAFRSRPGAKRSQSGPRHAGPLQRVGRHGMTALQDAQAWRHYDGATSAKFVPPTLPRHWVRRDRLGWQLSVAVQRPLTILTGPPRRRQERTAR